MARRTKADHTGQTSAGNTRDVTVEKVGPVTIYQRGNTYYLYYRQSGQTRREKVEGNLATARGIAHKVANALAENRPSPIAFQKTPPAEMVAGFLDAVEHVQQLALRTRDRYRAALDRFLDFCTEVNIKSVDAVELTTVEDFVRWLRGQTRSRNGSKNGKSRAVYQPGGVKFVLSTCRTAYNWASRRRMMPPYSENPFGLFKIDKMKIGHEADSAKVFTPDQEKAFFAACDDWQRSVFTILAAYGLRVGELTHLLIDDIDFAAGTFMIRGKPWLQWSVKTGRERRLPLLPHTRRILEDAVTGRAAGFVFVGPDGDGGRVVPPPVASPAAFRARVEKAVAEGGEGDRARKRAATKVGRAFGQVPERRVRTEFMRVTTAIGFPEFTRVHDLRHLFCSRAQERGVNPILVQNVLGHTTLDMTRRYSHLGIDTAREALEKLSPGTSEVNTQGGGVM